MVHVEISLLYKLSINSSKMLIYANNIIIFIFFIFLSEVERKCTQKAFVSLFLRLKRDLLDYKNGKGPFSVTKKSNALYLLKKEVLLIHFLAFIQNMALIAS